MKNNLCDRIAIVLVEPQSPGNIGSVCRAMKNFGFLDLRLVNPCAVNHPEAHKFAVSAKDLLHSARIFPSLAAALADSPLSVATTRRFGKYRQEIYTPEEIVRTVGEGLAVNRAAFVFGREADGLTTDELALCRYQASIPTADVYGSLNLAQAVLVFCYTLHRQVGEAVPVPEGRVLADTPELEELFGHMERTLLRIGFLNPQNPAHLMRTLRRVYARAGLDSREVTVLRGLLAQVDWAADGFAGRKGDAP